MSNDPAVIALRRQAIARQNGFSSYEAMQLWNQQRERQAGGTVAIRGATPQPDPRQARPVERAPSGGIGSIFDYIGSILSGANRK
jgi:hypothetical protein